MENTQNMNLTQKIQSGYYKGMIRILFGFLFVIGGAGGIETSNETLPLLSLTYMIIGFISLYYGVKASNSVEIKA